MTPVNHLATPPAHGSSLSKAMIQGATIALLLIIIFLLGVKDPDPHWGRLWMIKPLIIVPIAGAFGGLFYYMMGDFRSKGGWVTVIAYVVSIAGYIVALWLGTVLGLNGTLWN